MITKGIFKLAAIFFLLLGTGGCMSVSGTMNDEDNKIYIGSRTDLKAITYLASDEPAWGMIGLVDLPFSLVMDTLFLPYTIPHSFAGNEKEPNQAIKADEGPSPDKIDTST